MESVLTHGRARPGIARLALALVVAWLVTGMGPGLAHPAGAQAFESIPSYQVVIDVEAGGDLVVTETIDYDFSSSPDRHGIHREIPFRFHYDDRHDRLMPIQDVAVESPTGAPSAVSVTDSGGFRRIRIGDPDRTVSGSHTYVITYRVEGALNSFPGHSELYWNAVGHEWGVLIDEARVTVRAPAPSVIRVACFAGPRGSTLTCDGADHDAREAHFTQSSLGSGRGLTVVVALDPGAVAAPPPILEERWSLDRAFSRTPVTVVGAGLGTVAGVWGVVVLLWHRGRDRRWVGSHVDVIFGSDDGEDEPVPLLHRSSDPVEYEPPEGIRAGQMGTLVDEVAHPLDVTATIVDLAVRGYLRIEEVEKRWMFSRPDWKLVRLRDPDGLLSYERILLDGLFRSGDEVLLSELKQRFASRLAKVQSAMYDDMVARHWFARRPDNQRKLWTAIALAALVGAVAATVLLAATTRAGLLGLPLVITALVLLTGASRVPRRTARGFSVLRRSEGFRRFIVDSEAVRARFAEDQKIFTEYLPYAVVFGATDRWARAFEGLDEVASQAVSRWYVGRDPFTMDGFGRSMEDFSVTAAGTVQAAAPSGSSGFSGGGSSGGGGGGGGGGSW